MRKIIALSLLMLLSGCDAASVAGAAKLTECCGGTDFMAGRSVWLRGSRIGFDSQRAHTKLRLGDGGWRKLAAVFFPSKIINTLLD